MSSRVTSETIFDIIQQLLLIFSYICPVYLYAQSLRRFNLKVCFKMINFKMLKTLLHAFYYGAI